jgi:hypothetical protein
MTVHEKDHQRLAPDAEMPIIVPALGDRKAKDEWKAHRQAHH